MAGAVAGEFGDQVFQPRVVHHQHAAGPGVGAWVNRQQRAEAVGVHEHLLPLFENLLVRSGFGTRSHR
ncbi:hypothetical protein D3C78_1882610 [compost metagenome]